MTATKVAFQIGDKVRRPNKTQVWTVQWVSKCGKLIATEYNGYCNACDWAHGYEKAPE